MSLLAADIIYRATKILSDDGLITWTQPEILEWINDAQREIANHTSATAKTATVQLSPGVFQSLPEDAIRLIEVRRNRGSAGTTAGPAIARVTAEELMAMRPRTELLPLTLGARQVLPAGGQKILDVVGVRQTDQDSLNAYRPGWTNETAKDSIQNWFPDPHASHVWWCYPPATTAARATVRYVGNQWRTDPPATTVEFYIYTEQSLLTYDVYPPVSSSTAVYVELQYSKKPAVITAPSDTLDVPESYVTPLTDYVLWRAFSKEANAHPDKAAQYANSFAQAITAKLASDQTRNKEEG